MKRLVEADGGARHPHGQADEAAGGRLGARQAAARRTPSSRRDSGTITTWWARQIPAKRGQMYLAAPATWRRMACGLPYTIAAQIAYPDRQCVAFVGDGGFSMLMAEFATAVKYKLPIKVVVDQEQHARADQVGADGVPRQSRIRRAICSRSISRCSRRPAAATGFTIEDPARLRRASWSRRWHTPGRSLIEAVVDPYEPPMPANITIEQATKFAESLCAASPIAGRSR